MAFYKGKIIVQPNNRGYSTLTQAELYNFLDEKTKEYEVKIVKKEIVNGDFITVCTFTNVFNFFVLANTIKKKFKDRVIVKNTYHRDFFKSLFSKRG